MAECNVIKPTNIIQFVLDPKKVKIIKESMQSRLGFSENEFTFEEDYVIYNLVGI